MKKFIISFILAFTFAFTSFASDRFRYSVNNVNNNDTLQIYTIYRQTNDTVFTTNVYWKDMLAVYVVLFEPEVPYYNADVLKNGNYAAKLNNLFTVYYLKDINTIHLRHNTNIYGNMIFKSNTEITEFNSELHKHLNKCSQKYPD